MQFIDFFDNPLGGELVVNYLFYGLHFDLVVFGVFRYDLFEVHESFVLFSYSFPSLIEDLGQFLCVVWLIFLQELHCLRHFGHGEAGFFSVLPFNSFSWIKLDNSFV